MNAKQICVKLSIFGHELTNKFTAKKNKSYFYLFFPTPQNVYFHSLNSKTVANMSLYCRHIIN